MVRGTSVTMVEHAGTPSYSQIKARGLSGNPTARPRHRPHRLLPHRPSAHEGVSWEGPAKKAVNPGTRSWNGGRQRPHRAPEDGGIDRKVLLGSSGTVPGSRRRVLGTAGIP